jgi:UDP-N-acetylmuramoyl-tripeptide--D-alanyl-D-alanine ligase
VYLKITKRIIRLFISVTLLICLFYLFLPKLLIDFFMPLIIILADFINKPIEFYIRKHYIQKARIKLKNVNAIKISITGSYGKTSVKHYIADALKNKFLVNYSPKSYNTPLGIASFINNSELLYSEFLIYEFGARRVGDIRELKKLYDYNIAIVTGIGKMHIDTFKTQENIITEKMMLVEILDVNKFVILNYENAYIRNYNVKCNKYTYGFNFGEYQAKNVVLNIQYSKFELYISDEFVRKFIIKPIGKSAVLNILPAIILCHLYNINFDCIEEIESVDNRLSLRTFNDYYILDDAYNSNILGAQYALEVLESYNGKRFMITPGFAEMNLIKEELAIEYAGYIDDAVDHLILVRNNFTILLSKYISKAQISFVSSFKEGFALFLNVKENKSILLIENDLLE